MGKDKRGREDMMYELMNAGVRHVEVIKKRTGDSELDRKMKVLMTELLKKLEADLSPLVSEEDLISSVIEGATRDVINIRVFLTRSGIENGIERRFPVKLGILGWSSIAVTDETREKVEEYVKEWLDKTVYKDSYGVSLVSFFYDDYQKSVIIGSVRLEDALGKDWIKGWETKFKELGFVIKYFHSGIEIKFEGDADDI